MLESGGADVNVCWHESGHELGAEDVDASRAWLCRDNIRHRVAA
jgi:predicted esterase